MFVLVYSFFGPFDFSSERETNFASVLFILFTSRLSVYNYEA